MATDLQTYKSRQAGDLTTAPTETKTLWSIENLRTCAVLGVVVFHATCYGNLANHPKAPGLDIFFVISGFLVWHLTNARQYKSAQFFAHRLSRIFPLYAIMTIAFYLIAKAYPAIDMFHGANFSTIELFASLCFIPYTGSDGYRLPILAPGWTLNYDMYFFAIFSIVLLFKRNRLKACVMLYMIPVVLHLVIRPPTSALVEMLVSTRSITFLAGIAVAELLRTRIIMPAKLSIAVLCLATLFFLVLCILRVDYWHWGVLLWMTAPVVVLYASVCIEYHFLTWAKLPWCEKIGVWSYSIYLIHIFIIPFTMSLPINFSIGILLTLILSVYAGSVLNRFVERPINRFSKRTELRFGRATSQLSLHSSPKGP